jgi:hypothetical protein
MTPAAEPAAEKERTLPSARTAPAESAVLARRSAPHAKRDAPPTVTSSSPDQNHTGPVLPGSPAKQVPGETGPRTPAPDVPEPETVAAGIPEAPAQPPAEMRNPDETAPVAFNTDFPEEPKPPAALRAEVREAGGPKVHIGLIEVVVLAPENPPARKTTASAETHHFASRHYLRNL